MASCCQDKGNHFLRIIMSRFVGYQTIIGEKWRQDMLLVYIVLDQVIWVEGHQQTLI